MAGDGSTNGRLNREAFWYPLPRNTVWSHTTESPDRWILWLVARWRRSCQQRGLSLDVVGRYYSRTECCAGELAHQRGPACARESGNSLTN